MMLAVHVQRNRSELIPFLATLLVGSVLVTGAKFAWPTDPCGPSEIAAQDHSNEELGSQAIAVQVLSSLNKTGVMREMACRFEAGDPTIDGRPIDVTISGEASGAAYQSIQDTRPTVWSPAATSWVRMLRVDHGDWIPMDPPSIATSPQVIAMPRPIASALGWPDEPLGWKDIIRLAEHPSTWNDLPGVQPEWGDFKLAKTNPRLSTSGLNATVATFAIAAQTSSSNLTSEQIRDETVLRTVRAVESATVHYAPTSVDFLTNLRAQDDAGRGEGYASAILLEEKSVWDYNQGNPSGDPATLGNGTAPQTQLVAFYPSDGALVADHPYAILHAPWVTDDQRTAADRFLSFLLEPSQQERFQALGYRNAEGVPGDEISLDNGLISSQPTNTMEVPDGEVLKTIRETWPSYRKEARVLLVIDVSASMSNQPTSDSPDTKLDLAKKAALLAIKQLAPTDEVGLWTFSPSAAQPPWNQVVPIRPLSKDGEALEDSIRNLSVESGNRSQLYTTVEDASAAMYDHFDDSRINGIVLLSDGPNDGSLNNDEQRMLGAIGPRDPDREVRIFTIAYGESADSELLDGIATTSLGTSYDAKNAALITKVFPQVVANF